MAKLRDKPKVVLIWPGGNLEPAGTFGVPQILNLAQGVRGKTGADVSVIDLDMEIGLGPVDLVAHCRSADVVGISCYSSFDVLKVTEIARLLRAALPKLVIVTGGYHPSARAGEFTRPGSPFDYVVVGDGELPLARLVEAIAAGRRPLNRVLGPEALSSPREVMPYDWSLLERYRGVAKQRASQAEIYLSRGCPYDCSFCMERAKRETAWRALEPEEAVEELHRLDHFLDLRGWTLRVSDPLFGMKRTWRRRFLEELCRRPVRARKTWLLIRLDLVERPDFELMARANVAPGFGLESGDPEQLRRIRKTGLLSGYLDKMLDVAQWAREFEVPFGANIIVGHPGESEASLRTSAKFMERLFLDKRGTMGFLSVDPFRLYPGSPIDDDLDTWMRDTGMRAHRYPWWEDGDQAFLAEWIDPSDNLDYVRREALTQELFAPIVAGVRANFSYRGPALDYFRRAVDREVESFSSENRARRLALHALWSSLLEPERSEPQAVPVNDAAKAPNTTQCRTVDVERGPDWARAFFHVLAHVDVGALPSTNYDPRYVAYCAGVLGDASERALGDRVSQIARRVESHEQYARLQGLAAAFQTVDEARSAAGELELLAHDPTLRLGPQAAQLHRYFDADELARQVFDAVIEELPHWGKVPPVRPDPALALRLQQLQSIAPWLERLAVRHVDSLGAHGRLMRDAIWIGTPCLELTLDHERVAWQAAHEATLAEVSAAHGELGERERERLAVALLAERRGVSMAGVSEGQR